MNFIIKAIRQILLLLLLAVIPSMLMSASAIPHETDTLRKLLHTASPDEMAGIYIHLASTNLKSNATLSLEYCDTAIYLAGLNKQKELIPKANKIKGQAFNNLGSADSSILYLLKSVQQFEDLKDWKSLSTLIKITADVYESENKYREALNQLFQGLTLVQEANDSAAITTLSTRIGVSFYNWEKFDSAYIYYNRGLKLAEAIDDRANRALISNNLGTIYLSWGNYQRSLEFYMLSLKISEEIGDSTGISKALNNIGVIYFDWKEWDKSLEYYLGSFEVDSLMGNKDGQSQTLNNIAIIYDESGKDNKALAVYRRSLALATENENHYQIAITTSNMGGIYLEAKDLEKAEAYYFKTLQEYKWANSIVGEAETYFLLAELYKETGNYEKALNYYDQGLEIILPMNLSAPIMIAYSGMAEVYSNQGKFEEAFIYSTKYHHINDSVFNTETSNQLALLSNAFEIERKDQEMEIQQARLQEQKSRIRRQEIIVFALAGFIVISIVFTILLLRSYRLRMKAWKQLIAQHEELLQNRHKLLIAKEKAEESDQLKSAFLVNLSHELRTPMNGIMGFTDLLQKGTASPDQQQTYLEYIASSSAQLLRVLNDIIDISAIETNQLVLIDEPCTLHSIFSDLSEFFNREKKEMGKDSLSVKYIEPPEEERITILSDRKRLTQIVFNLIKNAVGFTHQGSVEFGYNLINGQKITIYIKDTGIGIQRDKFDVIFERFRQVDGSTTRQHGGSGLGLALCKELVHLMGGRIYLKSELGAGSTFFVDLQYKEIK